MKWRSLQEANPGSDLRPLREQYAERKELIAKYVPADVQAVHERTVSALKAQGFAAKALGVGAKTPAFELSDHNGKRVLYSDLLSRGRLVISFIRGRWCPFCVGQMESMSAIAEQIQAAGGSLVAISPQTEKQAFFMHDQHKLRFPILVDTHNAVAHLFGLAYRVPDEQQAMYRSTFVNLPFVNGDNSWELPIPATYVITSNGNILFAAPNENYMERPEPLDILALLETSA
ncbi:MAG: AhpC/TSA family protein [Acidobacteria bacterium]|nr:AhpC/TSA family protein [Acidobacteriota bacterium]